MARGSKDKTVSSVSDILGFIWEQSKKPPDRRQPVKADDGQIDANSEYISTLVEALALPGTFVGDRYLDALQGLVDPAVKVGTYKDRIGTVKIKLGDLSDFFDNPDKFIDNLFEKNKPISNKLQRLQWAGEQMKMIHGSMYARREKLFESYSPEMREILIRAVGQTAGKPSQPVDQIWLHSAARELMNKGSIGGELERLRNALKSENSRNGRRAILQRIKKIEDLYDMATNVNNSDYDLAKGSRDLLDKEFEIKGREILNGRNKSQLNETEILELNKFSQARNLLELWGEYDGLKVTKEEVRAKRLELGELKRDLIKQKEKIKTRGIFEIDGNRFDYSNLSNEERKRALREVNERIKGNTKASATLGSMRVWGALGNLEGLYWTLTATLGSGGLAAILSGDFYDPKKGYFGCPSIERTLKIGTDFEKKKDDWRDIKFVKARKDVYRVREGKEIKLKERSLVNKYNDTMVWMYYHNPATLVKTLFTGERFAWEADKKTMKLAGMFSAIKGDQWILSGMKDPNFWNFFAKYQKASEQGRKELLKENYNYELLLEKVTLFLKKNPNFIKKAEQAQKLAKQFENYKTFAMIFSGPQSLLNLIEKKGAGATEGIRRSVAALLETVFTGDEVVKEILDEWVKKGVGKSLVSGITAGIVNAIGLAGTAVAGPLSFVITWVLSEFLEKIAKVTIKILIFAIVGIFGLVILFAGIFTFSTQAQTDSYSREYPGSVDYNDYFESYGGDGIGLEDPDDPDYPGGELGEFIPGDLPEGETCLFTAGASLRCTQGPYSSCNDPAYKQPSHHNSPAIDVAVGGNFAAPQFCDKAEGNCKVVSVGQATCSGGYPAGGYVTFTAEYEGRVYIFYILHVAIGVSSGEVLGPGQAVATITDDDSWHHCSTGLHAHITVKVNDSYVNPRDALNQDFGCSIGECPVENVCYILK